MHIMIDLETLGSHYHAVVREIGWALFDPYAPEEGVTASNRVVLDVAEQLKLGREVDWDTMKWWLQQSGEARGNLINGTSSCLKLAFDFIDSAIPWTTIEGIWGHGATFDISLMDSLYRTEGRKAPWHFRNVRDTRTLFWLTPALVWPDNAIKHSAVADAVCQAVAVQRAIKLLTPRSI